MNRSFVHTAILAVAILVLVASCSAAKRAEMAQSESPGGGAAAAQDGNRLLVKTASIEIVVPLVTEALAAASRIVDEFGGYVHDSVSEKDDAARLKLRIPANQLSTVLDRLAGLGEERRREVSVEDVTETVADLDAELANKRALRDRLRALLVRAKDVKDVLSVEGELTRLQTDIDSLESRLKRMRTDIQFSAVDLKLSPREPAKKRRILGPLGYLYVGTKWLVTKLFVIRSGEP